METIRLGHSDLTVSRLGFGCWQLGGHGWQNTDRQAILQAIDHALGVGINFFDTADIYGLGESETLLGEALAGHDKQNAIVATKFGVRFQDGTRVYDNSQRWIHEAVEASLKRLKRETIDLYQLHWHDGTRPLADIFLDLERLREQGKIRWYGLSNVSPTLLKTSAPDGLVSFTSEYSLLQRQQEAAIDQWSALARLGFIAWGSLAQGLLSGKYSRVTRFAPEDLRSRPESLFAPDRWDTYEPVLLALQQVAKLYGRSMAQVALRWVLDKMPHALALTGIKSISQLNENAGALGWDMATEHHALLEKATQHRVG